MIPDNKFFRSYISSSVEDCSGMVSPLFNFNRSLLTAILLTQTIALNKIMSNFPKNCKIIFANTRDTEFKPIFASEHTTEPDVAPRTTST